MKLSRLELALILRKRITNLNEYTPSRFITECDIAELYTRIHSIKEVLTELNKKEN